MNLDFIDLKDLSFYIMFIILYFIVPWALIEATYSEKCRIDLKPLWTYKKVLDKFAAFLVVAFWCHTSYMILWTLTQKVTTTDWLAYAGVWVTPILVKMVGAAFGNEAPTVPTTPPATQPAPTITAP